MNYLNNHYLSCLIAFLLSAFSTSMIMPSVLKIGEKFEIFDEPDQRKLHTKPIIRIGGLSIFFGTSVGLILFYLAGLFNSFDIVNKENLITTLFFCFLFFCLGIFDDLFSLSPFSRLILQIIFSIIFFSKLDLNYSIQLPSFLNYAEPIRIPSLLSNIFAVIWLVGITNAFNWLDGIDGLASGISLLIGIPLCFLCFEGTNPTLFVLALSLSGSCAGFLKDNLISKNILMGDGGSYLLGFSIASMSLTSIPKNLNLIGLIIPLFIIFVPFLDMVRVILLRLIDRISPFYPDRKHIHYYLIDHGLGLKNTLFILYMVSISTSFFGIGLLYIENFKTLSSLSLITLMIGLIPLFLRKNLNNKI